MSKRSRDDNSSRGPARCWEDIDGGVGCVPVCKASGLVIKHQVVAEEMRAPIYSLSAGSLGTDPSHVQGELSDAFKRATKWNAIILLDEADIFLEQRSVKDLRRNQLVSGA
jgi:hypothetical protein